MVTLLYLNFLQISMKASAFYLKVNYFIIPKIRYLIANIGICKYSSIETQTFYSVVLIFTKLLKIILRPFLQSFLEKGVLRI